MINLLTQIKLPGVLLAKANLKKEDFNNLLKANSKYREKLKEIGYVIKLSPSVYTQVTQELNKEKKEMDELITETEERAEVLTNCLTKIFIRLSEMSSLETQSLYHLSQILFIWDEFIDFDEYQTSGYDISKIRESVFYRGATLLLKEINKDKLKELMSYKMNIVLFEDGLHALQLLNSTQNLTIETYMKVLSLLRERTFSDIDILYFLLVLESALFISLTEKIVHESGTKNLEMFNSVTNVEEGINLFMKTFAISADQLETMLEHEAETFVIKLDSYIFAQLL